MNKKQLAYLFRIAKHSWIIHIVVIWLLVIGWEHMPENTHTWVFWAPIMTALSLAMLGVAWTYIAKQDKLTHTQVAYFAWAHSILTAIIGVFWGVGAVLLANSSSTFLLVYSLALGGTALGAVSSQHALLRSCFLSIWTSIPLLCVAHILHDESFWYGGLMAIMFLLFGLVLSILSYRMNLFFNKNMMLLETLEQKVKQLQENSALLKQANSKVTEASLSKSRFLVHASHDLRHPIQAIALLSNSLKDTKLNSHQTELVDLISSSVESVSSLFRSLLDISRLDMGEIRVVNQVVDLTEIMNRAVHQTRILVNNSGEYNNINSDIRMVACRYQVYTDAALLQTILQNLLLNAIKYGNGKVLLGVRRKNTEISISVYDQGLGIEKENLESLFDDFYRVSSEDKQQIPGLGLGLSIVKRLCDKLGFEISVNSTVGRGTCFSISGIKPLKE